MIEAIEWLRMFIGHHQSLEYTIIFFGTVFGGELALFTLGFLVAQGVISALPAALIGFIGSFFPNILWYWLGRTRLAERILSHKYASPAAQSITEAVTLASRKSHLLAIIIAKFMVGTPVILTLYIQKTKLGFKKFMAYQAVALFLSLILLIPVGFLSGLGFTYFSRVLENIYVSIGFLLLIIILLIMAQSWLKKKITKDMPPPEKKADL